MTAIVWDDIGERTYESGVDRGVLYLSDGRGVPWNGLTSVDEKFTGAATSPLYFEGVKYNEVLSIGDFGATLKAYTYPDEFLEFEGLVEAETGFYVTGQTQGLFGLSYRTKIGNDLNGDAGYKIHILCNLTAIPSQKAFKSNSLNPSIAEFEWTISAIPARISGFRPTSQLIFDSIKTNPTFLSEVEDILYGTDTTDAMLPSFVELLELATTG